MSIEDDVFDIQDALIGKVESHAFDRLMNRFNFLESEVDRLLRQQMVLIQSIEIVTNEQKNQDKQD